MHYRPENLEILEKRLEWFAGPLIVAMFAAIICAVLVSRATGF